MAIEFPQSFVTYSASEQAAWQNGFRKKLGQEDGWAAFGSTTAKGTIFLASDSINGSWYVAIDHPGVAAELPFPKAYVTHPGIAAYSAAQMSELYPVLTRIYELSVSLPDGPLEEFQAATDGLPEKTEAERLVKQRIGQGIFRNRLISYWQGRCPISDISDTELLRASHIKPWKDCENDAERLDVHNGILLSALWDAAFDNGLVTFKDDGTPRFSSKLSAPAMSSLSGHSKRISGLTAGHKENLIWHRDQVFNP